MTILISDFLSTNKLTNSIFLASWERQTLIRNVVSKILFLP